MWDAELTQNSQTQRHTYRICSTDNNVIRGLPDVITFASYHANMESSQIPDTSRCMLPVVELHMSGTAGYVDIIDDFHEGKKRVLSVGGSNTILEFSLLGAGVGSPGNSTSGH